MCSCTMWPIRNAQSQLHFIPRNPRNHREGTTTSKNHVVVVSRIIDRWFSQKYCEQYIVAISFKIIHRFYFFWNYVNYLNMNISFDMYVYVMYYPLARKLHHHSWFVARIFIQYLNFRFSTKYNAALNYIILYCWKVFQTSFTNMLVALLQNYLPFT